MSKLAKFNILEIKKTYLPDWHFEKTIHPMSNIRYHCIKERNSSIIEEINPRNIIGTGHINYAGKPWIQMLSALKRHNRLACDYDIEVVKNAISHNPPSVLEIDGKYFIIGGNHRLCQAKFLEISTVNCWVTKCVIDEPLYQLYVKFKAAGFDVECEYGIIRMLSIHGIECSIANGWEYESLLQMFDLYNSIHISKWGLSCYFIKSKAKTLFNKNDAGTPHFWLNMDPDTLLKTYIMDKMCIKVNSFLKCKNMMNILLR